MTMATDGMTDEQIIQRYNRLASIQVPGGCFICGSRRPTVLAYVLGPNTTDIGGVVARRGHSVCRPCTKLGEAARAR